MISEQDTDFDDLFNELQEQDQRQSDAMNGAGQKVLRLAREYNDTGETIIQLSTSRWYVNAEANLLELADDLGSMPEIPAVGVIDDRGKCIGLIKRSDLFDLLGRPFGRDVMRREQVDRVTIEEEPIFYDTSIFSVADRLDSYDHRSEVRFFPLKNQAGEFAGIFSSQDLLIHLAELTRENTVLARAVQNRIVRELSYLDKAEFELAASSSVSRGVGGDFYTLKNYSPDRWFLTLCDVSGKGVSAALLGSALWGIIKAFDSRKGIGPLIKNINEYMTTSFALEKYLTGVFIDLRLDKGIIEIADMGHGLAFIMRDGRLLKIRGNEKNGALGVREDMEPEVFHYRLEPGDIILLLTDGLVSQENREGVEFGLRNLKEFLLAHLQLDLKTMRSRLLERFQQHRGSVPMHDDVSFCIVRYKGRDPHKQV